MTRIRCRFAAAVIILINCVVTKRKNRKKRRCWVKEWIAKRNKFGAFSQLLCELKLQDSDYYKNFLRMSDTDFNFLLQKVTPKIQKKNTVMRSAISAAERLAVTLKFLAGGEFHT